MSVVATVAALLLCGSAQVASASELQLASSISSAASSALSVLREVYTTNAICGKNNCINPIFPGLEDLHRLQQSRWVTSTLQKTSMHMSFCQRAINYDPALPTPNGGGPGSIKWLVQQQDNAASTAFYYHLTGLGIEGWDHQQPEFSDDECIKSIWRMTCFTYFPRAQVGSMEGAYSPYIRPCESTCQSYIRSCSVECCDESVQCVFSHTKALSASKTITTQGYVPNSDGPSDQCTGAAHRSATPLGALALLLLQGLLSLDGSSIAGGMRSLFGRRVLIGVTFAVLMLSLQGCDYDVPTHRIGNWRREPDYLIKNEFIPPGGSPKSANLNSCSLQRLSSTLQCSGRGVCKMWHPAKADNNLAFCECDTYWADAECRTPRKSQATAYGLSMFFGMFGADQFYLGFTSRGLAKLFTLGGFGIWWVVDIIRIGSAPAYAHNYRTAADLPHWLYVLTSSMFAILLGFGIAYRCTQVYRSKKLKEAMILQQDEENRQIHVKPLKSSKEKKSDFEDYGAAY